MTNDGPETDTSSTVGQVAASTGVTVKTLHHYDDIGLVRPSGRSAAGYRLYTCADVDRLRDVVVYRRLGLALDEIRTILDEPKTDVAGHLRRQRAAVASRLAELTELVAALDHALEATMSGTPLTPQEQRELFGESFSEDYAQEAERRWGDTDAWRQSQARTAGYTAADWQQVKAEADAVTGELAACLRAGEPADGDRAMAAAEAHRRHITDRFYDVPYAMHRGLGQMYVDDERFRRTYDEVEPGLAAYVRDAIRANADRNEPTAAG